MTLFLDVSMLLRWSGPPVGILRVEAELARHAVKDRQDIDFVFFDARVNGFRRIARHVIEPLVEGRVGIDVAALPDARFVKRGPVKRALNRFDRQLWPLRRPRRFAIQSLEWLRSRSPHLGGLVDRLQTPLLTTNYRLLFFDREGKRRPVLPVDEIIAGDLVLDQASTILSAGSDWNTKNPFTLRDLKAKLGFRYAMVCFDLIPIRFGRFYKERDRAVFAAYFREALHFVDRFICISEATARDLRDFARREEAAAPWVRVEPLGAEPPKKASGRLPDGLETKHYALYVSTIEPRKNHALLYRVWLRLLDQGIPQAAGFKLVFVGRRGWDTDELIAAFSSDARVRDSLVHLTGVDDGALAELYGSAAFCMYASIYEGFGLPVIEAFSYGRAVIASRGGSIPEVVGDLGPCLDPADEEAWLATMAQWITDPAVVEAYEAKLTGFRAPTWSQVAARYFALAFGDEAAVKH
jgi:glycosyltransferase involved in cell wall biosynthesis